MRCLFIYNQSMIMKNRRNFILSLFLLGMSLGSQLAAQTSTTLDLMFPNVVISRFHYDKLKEDINKPDNNAPKAMYLRDIKNPADKIIESGRKTTPIVSNGNNPQKVNTGAEMKAIYQLCVSYAFTQEPKYMNKAVEYLKAWAEINKAEPKSNIHEEVYSQGVEAYSIIRRVIAPGDRQKIDSWVRARADVFLAAKDLRWNNWGTCLLVQYYTFGLTLEDPALVAQFTSAYPEWVKGNLFPNGVTTDLLGRDAFAYHAYDLLFFSRLCRLIALYEGYEKADEFYAQDVNWGASIRKSVDFWKPYLLNPEKNSHVEFAETDYDGDKSRSDYNKTYVPSSTVYVADELYEFDQDLKKALDKYRSGNLFATWKLGLSALRWHYGEPQTN